MVAITLDSTPHGAQVFDANGKVLGKTPVKISAPGSHTPRQFNLKLRGYGESTIELPFTKAQFAYTEPLVKGASSAAPVVHKVDDTGKVTAPDTSTAITHPEAGSAAIQIKTPELPGVGSAAVVVKPPEPPNAGSAAAKPPEPPNAGSAAAKQADCPDDEMPCLKGFGSNK